MGLSGRGLECQFQVSKPGAGLVCVVAILPLRVRRQHLSKLAARDLEFADGCGQAASVETARSRHCMEVYSKARGGLGQIFTQGRWNKSLEARLV